MWEWIKSSPWTWAVGALIALGAVAGVIWGIVTKGRWKDVGFMKDEAGHPLTWDKTNMPIIALAHPDLPLSWWATYQAAATRLNAAAGAKLFDPVAQNTPAGYRLNGPVPPGFIMVLSREPAGELQVDHGVTILNWRKPEGKIFSATVDVPTEAAQRAAIMLHELGHVLGLDHDESTSSIMFPRLSARLTPGDVTGADAERLRKAYG